MIKGLQVIEDFLTREEEKALLENIKLSHSIIGSERNSIKRYGSRLPYNARIKSESIPEYFDNLCRKLVREGHLEIKPDSVTVNEYRKGQKLGYHFDSERSGPIITVLSLLGDAWMGMKEPKSKDGEWRVLLKKRSLLIMEGEARYKYQHCIFPVPSDRLSLVFRKGTL